MVSALSLAVVGADFPNKRGPGRRFEIELCAPGDPVELVPEPKNPKDENAVMVVSERGVQMGYVTAERAPLVGGWLRAGRDVAAVFQEKTSWGAVIRVALDGAPMNLPPASAAPKRPLQTRSAPRPEGVDDESGFWPDPIYPDE